MASRQADEMLENHPSYYSVDRLGNRWFQGRYRPGIREWGYPIRLPPEEWGKMAKLRGGFEQRNPAPFRRTLNKEVFREAIERPSGDD